MELLFLWVDRFRGFQDESFSFSSEIDFKLSRVSKGSYLISASLNKEFENPYSSPLLRLTGIAGENGAGKSSLLDCLKLIYGSLGTTINSMIFCHLDRTTGKVYTHYYSGGGKSDNILNVENLGNEDLGSYYILTKPKPYTISRFLDSNQKVKGLTINFSKLACAYLSSNFDNNPENIYKGIVNVSTKHRLDNYLNDYVSKVEDAIYNSTSRPKRDRKNPDMLSFNSHLQDYYKLELRSNIRMIAYANQRQRGRLPELPSHIVISFNFEDFQYLLQSRDEKHLQIDLEELKTIQSRAMSQLQSINDRKDVFHKLVYLCAFYNAIRFNLFGNNENHYTSGDLRGLVSHISKTEEDIFDEISIALNELSIFDEDKKEKFKLRELLSGKLEVAIKEAPFIEEHEFKLSLLDFSFRIEKSIWQLLSIVFDYQYNNESGFMDYNWGHPLSTGEQARLNQFSRLYEIKSRSNGKFLMLLVDEGDLYYHPQWQKHYVNDIIDGLNFIFPRGRVQLVISTHSPFILSDIPKQNLIFLKRERDELGGIKCKVSRNHWHTETFGANIHELFTDSFFLRDGLMGVFAQEYIDGLIKDINNEEFISTDKFRSHFKKKIDLVGDQFLKAKILELAASKCDADTVDGIIEYRNQEIQALQRIRDLKRSTRNGKN
ncbi:AAA family ATPase [Pedobacter ureilyticus]|nr:AAA family ATPase [Pedobacter helvus]